MPNRRPSFNIGAVRKFMTEKKTFYDTQERRRDTLMENLLLLHSPTNTTSQKYLSQRRVYHLHKPDLETSLGSTSLHPRRHLQALISERRHTYRHRHRHSTTQMDSTYDNTVTQPIPFQQQ